MHPIDIAAFIIGYAAIFGILGYLLYKLLTWIFDGENN